MRILNLVLLAVFTLCSGAGLYADDQAVQPSIKAFLSGPLVVSVKVEGSDSSVEVCWALFEDPRFTEQQLATTKPPATGSCPDKGLFLAAQQPAQNRALNAEVPANVNERVRLSEKDSQEWELEVVPTMHYFLNKPNDSAKGKWIAFCTMRFRPATGSSDERKDIFCDRKRPVVDKTKAICPSPSECVKNKYETVKAKLISDPTLIPHATASTETHKSDTKPADKVEITTTSRPIAPKK